MEYSENENIFIDKKNTQINLFFINFLSIFYSIDWLVFEINSKKFSSQKLWLLSINE